MTVIRKVLRGPETTLHQTRVLSDDCPPESDRFVHIQFELLRTLWESPDLSNCGPSRFQRMTIRHDGMRWVAECEAVVPTTKE